MSKKIETKCPELSVTLDATWMNGRLRADDIRRSVILALAREWAENDAAVMYALDWAAEVQSGQATPEETDAAVANVEELTDDDTHLTIGLADARRLRSELDAVIAKLERFEAGPQAVAS